MQDKTLQKIETSLKERGERFTEPRQRVMSALLNAQGPQTAYNIVEKMKDMKPMSVYRALDFLSAQGLAHRIESLNAYVSCVESHCAHKDSQYLICDSCGSVEELHNHAIDDFITKTLSKSGFQLNHKVMELRGLCTQCSH
jgi:Fur family transcriptional regulator, zinc uptake regulator